MRAAPVLLFALAAGAPAPRRPSVDPAAQPAVRSTIVLSEPLTATLLGDVDGDGRKDAVLLTGDRVAVHRQRPGGAFPPSPDETVKLPADTVAVDLEPFDAAAGGAPLPSRLLVAGASGVRVRALDAPGGAFEPLALPELADPLIPRAAGATPIEMTLAADLDADGVAELILPTAAGPAILRRAGASWSLLGVAQGIVDARLQTGPDRPGASVTQTFELPRIAPMDVSGPGGKTIRYLTITQDQDARVYSVKRDGLELVEHMRALYRLDAEDRMRIVRGTRRNEQTTDRAVGLTPVDFNADAIPDFVSSRFKDGEVQLILGARGELATKSPTRVIDADGWVILAQARDFDGDGRADLIVPRLPKLGVMSALRVLLSRKISFDLWVFRNEGGPGIVSQEPVWKRTFDIEIVLSGEEGQFSATARLLTGFYDVNGDGLVDLVSRNETGDRLTVHLGDRAAWIRDEPAMEIEIPSVDEWSESDLRASDLDGDGRDDLLVTYGPVRRGAKNQLVLLVWKRG